MKKINHARAELIELSKVAKEEIENILETEGIEISVNEWLIEHYKSKSGAMIFKTYNQWKEEGYQVKKGSACFRVWAKPRKVPKSNDSNDSNDSLEKKYKFWPIANLFSDLQVEPVEDKAA